MICISLYNIPVLVSLQPTVVSVLMFCRDYDPCGSAHLLSQRSCELTSSALQSQSPSPPALFFLKGQQELITAGPRGA